MDLVGDPRTGLSQLAPSDRGRDSPSSPADADARCASSRSSASSPQPAPALTAEKEEAQKAIRMKTTRQLKEIFDGAGLEYSGLDKEGLQKLAYKNHDALKDKLERKKRPSSGGGGGGFGGGIPGMENMKAPDGMDQDKGRICSRRCAAIFRARRTRAAENTGEAQAKG